MDLASKIKEKFEGYKNTASAKEWLDSNFERVSQLFSNRLLRDFIFEPFKSVFDTPEKSIDRDIYSVITQVAIINAVLAGLPGKMGVGVYVSIALEAWMAYSIARHVGIKEIKSVSDIWKYLGLLAAFVATILWGFKILLSFGFSLFSFVIPGINPLIFAELFVTNLVGVFFWTGFVEAKESGSFRIPKRLVKNSIETAFALFKHQFGLLKAVFNKENITTVGRRLVSYLKGDIPTDQKQVNGDLFATAAMAYLVSGQYEKLEGPLGETFIEAIRMRWSGQFDADSSIEEIAQRFAEYDSDQIVGVINTIKGKMFEILVTEQENLDGDAWIARMHTDESFPGSDIVLTNIETGEVAEVSLKAVSEENASIIEHSLGRYPDIPIMTTDEAAAMFDDSINVFGSGFLHEELETITEESFESLIASIEVNAHEVVIGGVTVGTMAALWPFTMAYLRGKITGKQLERVYGHILGDAGLKLASRVTYALILGPLFAWYLLARGVKGMVSSVDQSNAVIYLEFMPGLISRKTVESNSPSG